MLKHHLLTFWDHVGNEARSSDAPFIRLVPEHAASFRPHSSDRSRRPLFSSDRLYAVLLIGFSSSTLRMHSSSLRRLQLLFMARNASHFAVNWPTSRSNEFRQKKPKKWHRPTHGFRFFTWTWRASFAKLTNDHVSWCLFVQVFSREISPSHFVMKTPKLVLTSCFSLKRYSERLLLFELSSSLSQIDDVFIDFRKRKVTTRTLHWDVKTSFHLQTAAYDHARTDSVPSQGRRHLELCRSLDCALPLAPRFLAPVHVYIHFQAHWACLVVIQTNEKPV